jgi:hypothetical protein
MSTARAIPNTKVITGKVRGSYVNVFRARRNDLSGQDEYSLVVLIPKTDKKTVDLIQGAIDTAKNKKWAGRFPANFRDPMRDGDEMDSPNEAYSGHYYINTKSKQRPGVVDADRQEIIDPNDFISGDYCRVSMNAYAYDQKGNRGVAFGLNNVQVLEKGEPLTSRARAEDDFADSEDDAW